MASLLDEATATNRQALGDAATTFGADMQETHAELLQEIRAVEERASKHSQAIAVAAARESAEVQDALLFDGPVVPMVEKSAACIKTLGGLLTKTHG